MGGGQDDFDDGAGPSAWSLVYAPDTALQPATCRACRNVFAADAEVCPWCGHAVSPTVDHASVRHLFPASALPSAAWPAAALPPGASEPEPADRASDGSLPIDRLPDGRPTQARRWAGLLVAAGVILAIATGVAVRSRGTDREPAAVAPKSATTRVASPATTRAATTVPAASTTPATTAPSTVPVTSVAATTLPASTIPVTTIPATTIPATTAPATTVPVATTSPAGPVLSESEQRAVTVTRDLSSAIVAHDWNHVRSLAPRNTASDQTYETFWGTIESATVVPARVATRADGTYDVFVGVLNVTSTPTGRTSSLICGRYTVDVGAGIVIDVVTRELRRSPGALAEAAVASELRTSCRESGL